MPTHTPEKQDENREKQKRQQVNALIEKHVIQILGQPGDLCRVQVRRLWEDHYRVNVLVGADVVSARVMHSYFLRTDGDGNIVASSPKITKTY